MIVVDSSVWIDFLNGRKMPHVERLCAVLGNGEIVVGDLTVCEVLQGLASERAARQRLRPFAALRDRTYGGRGDCGRSGP